MLKFKIISISSWLIIAFLIITVYLAYVPEFVAAPIISVLIAIGFIAAGLGFMAKPKEEEKEEREDPFIGY